jgi:hypothetical protein
VELRRENIRVNTFFQSRSLSFLYKAKDLSAPSYLLNYHSTISIKYTINKNSIENYHLGSEFQQHLHVPHISKHYGQSRAKVAHINPPEY